MKTGFIALHRKLLDSPIWQVTTVEQKVILITLLLMANHSEKKWYWQGEEFICQPGQFITSLPNIAKTAGKNLTVQNVRTALKKFENLNFLTDQSTKTGRLITIVNWQAYQGKKEVGNKQPNSQLTDSQQTPNRRPNSQLTSNNYDNNITMINNDNNNACAREQTQNGFEVNEKEKGFERFWELYPSKRKRPVAKIAWFNMRVHSTEQYEIIYDAVRRYSLTEQWQEADGRYIPDPDTFLQDERWGDDIPEPKKKKTSLW